MVDESTGKPESNYMEVKPDIRVAPIKVKKVKPPTMWPCAECKKTTRSHKYPDGTVLCHRCFEAKTEEELDDFAKAHSNRPR